MQAFLGFHHQGVGQAMSSFIPNLPCCKSPQEDPIEPLGMPALPLPMLALPRPESQGLVKQVDRHT